MERNELQEALNHMYLAEEILLNQLRDPAILCREVAEGLDCLIRAIKMAEKPESPINICAQCDSISFEVLADDRVVCLDCDTECSDAAVKEVCA